MHSRLRAGLIRGLLLTVALPTAGCLIPNGPKVIVDSRVENTWSGDGVLIERSPDGRKCKVAVRSDALIVERRWVPCKYVHDTKLPN
jgi:hypothetical protein